MKHKLILTLFIGMAVSVFAGSPKRGICNFSESVVTLHPTWGYSWQLAHKDPNVIKRLNAYNIEYVPMVRDRKVYSQVKRRGIKGPYFLGLNEPDSDHKRPIIPVDEAIEMYTYLQSFEGLIGSPSPTQSDRGDRWFKEFMKKAEKKNIRIDFITYHKNGKSVDWHKNRLDTLYRKYEKPIWVTEISCLYNNTSKSISRSMTYMKDLLEMLDAHKGVERYCWFSGAAEHIRFVDENGELTELAKRYRDHRSKRIVGAMKSDIDKYNLNLPKGEREVRYLKCREGS